MNQFMLFQSCFESKLRRAIFTRVWFFTCMNSFMASQNCFLPECFVTITARIWLFISMNKFMILQNCSSPKVTVYIFGQGLLNQMDRTLRACAEFESSNLGLILGTQIGPRGQIFWTIIFHHQKIQVKIYLMRGQT